MTLQAEIERIRSYPSTASEQFRRQLDAINQAGQQQQWGAGNGHQVSAAARGVDRSRELNPIARPMIVRTSAG